MLRAVNKFKEDFGGQVVSIERVQPSSDHVPHRYLLAEAGDTLFASFIGTKQYKDVIADANILQCAIFHEDDGDVDLHEIDISHSIQADYLKTNVETLSKFSEAKTKSPKLRPKPAAHRGFMARAKGIPALELYRLAQKKKQKLVLCGHSLGGAVAALATLAILRAIATSPSMKEQEGIQVKCITFSQPPVGNAALRDYVNIKGWKRHFKTYCIPEDLIPRILSPAYFHHYTARSLVPPEEGFKIGKTEKLKENEEEKLVLGLGPVQTSFWRLSRLVPLEGMRKKFSKNKRTEVGSIESSSAAVASMTSALQDVMTAPQSLEIQEGSNGISLKPFMGTERMPQADAKNGLSNRKTDASMEEDKRWLQMSLPSYVPFGQLYLLGNSSVESLSGAEYSKLTLVRSVITELRERFQSHSMKSYRSRFQRIYDQCMNDDTSSFLGVEQLQHFPHLQKWLGLSIAGTVELGHIVESPVVRAATSIVPLGWSGITGQKNGEPLKVDITGFGLHLCTLVRARVNGIWCSTTLESLPSSPTHALDGGLQPDIQKMRVLIGPPLRQQPKDQMREESFFPLFPSIHPDSIGVKIDQNELNPFQFQEAKFICPKGLDDFVVFCTSDFSTVSKEVCVRTRRVHLIGLEGSGKTSLLKAILAQDGQNATAIAKVESLQMDVDVREGIAGGLCYSDSVGVNLQDLNAEVSNFKDELWKGICDLSKKIDLVLVVHNLSHRVARYSQEPALSLVLHEAKSLGIPWVLAVTNKFSVSAHQQKAALDAVLKAYEASPSITGVVNSCPYIMPSASTDHTSSPWSDDDGKMRTRVPQNFVTSSMELIRRPFQKKAAVLPVEGVSALCQVIHCALQRHEEAARQELAQERLVLETERENAMMAAQAARAKANSLSAAAVGASLGAGLGLVLAVVMGAASALRKP
ncbi:uncharacterized protein LOC124913845 isoform X2 [Impatiens glandulifera]|nr:uncharacterized protein LOC124913845 isoform X2 [Impatiens glandulifera]